MMTFLAKNHLAFQALGDLATAATLLAISIGGLFALYKLASNRRLQFNLSARSLYYEYVKMSIEFPEYFQDFWSREDLDDQQREKYFRFVVFMLNGIEDIICTNKSYKWRTVLKQDLRPHVSLFRSPKFEETKPFFFPETYDLIDEVTREPNPAEESANA